MMMASPKLMDKDEQLQLCIQRFVSDTQSMINQFSEVFIGELRRFADVCMEFSVAYRGVQEERQFLTAENKSLKDELEARTAEVDFLGKELREIREENDELIRRLECFNINSEGEFSMGSRSNSVRSRPYAVVNSMPAFPRRFSEAIGYGPLNSACDNRKVSVDINLSTDLASTSKTQILLTPPVPFKNNGNDSSLSSKTIGEETTPTASTNSNTPRYHSRDKIAPLYAHLLNNSDNQLTKPSNSSTSMTNERSPSVDEIRNGPKMMDKTINNGNLSPLQSQILSNAAVSSSAGTFYDCCSRSNIDVNDSGLNSNRKKLLTVTDQIRQILDNHKPNETNIYVNQKSPPLIALSPAVMTGQSSERNDPINENHVINVEPKQLKKRHSITVSKPLLETDINHHGNSFIAKSPSPNVYDFDRHFDKYRCDTDLVASSGPDIDEDVAFLLESPPVQRYNSKKIAKKRKNRRKTMENKPVGDVVSDSILQNGLNTIMMKCADAVSVIPSPYIDLNRYLLVEVCHIISPSHFYLIVNDEKVGTNAFEDFLEHFQNFYKSIEEESYQRSFEEHANNDDEEERDLRLLVSIPPPAQALTLGSFWACYIDDELDWRRIQIIGDSSKKPGEITDLNGEDLILVKDVDSGYSSMVHSQMIRPLTDEMARVPAFAIRASLAFIYPHLNNNNNNNVKEENIMKNINHKDHHSEYYDQWPMECCQFFEDMTYDQILTASVLQINQEITPSDETDIAQVLLWCTSKAEDFEVFINRKLIELNYATNIADDDSWMEQFSDMNMNQSSAVACFEYPPEPRPESPPSIETCFNIQLTNVANATVSASFQPDQLNQTKQPTCNGSTSITGNAEMVVEKSDHDDQPTQSRKIKIKTRSKKKKGSLSETREENKECPESSDPTTATVPQPAAQISKIGGVEEKKETIIKSSSSIVIQDPTNSSLQSSQEHESKNSKTASNDQSPPPPLYWFAATSLLLFLISFYITSIA